MDGPRLADVTVGVPPVKRTIWPSGAGQDERARKHVAAVARTLGTRIRELRQKHGWSQEYLAELASVHRTYLWGMERGVRNPSLRHLSQIADALGVSIADLFLTTDLHGQLENSVDLP
jgi:DNA-binding XRE family transcriptional regulator